MQSVGRGETTMVSEVRLPAPRHPKLNTFNQYLPGSPGWQGQVQFWSWVRMQDISWNVARFPMFSLLQFLLRFPFLPQVGDGVSRESSHVLEEKPTTNSSPKAAALAGTDVFSTL